MNGTSLSSASDFKRYLPNRAAESIFMQSTDPAEVFSSIMSLNSNKSCGVDYIPTKIVQLFVSIISEPVAVLVNNKAFSLGIFRDSLKIAKVVPIKNLEISITHQIIDLFFY